MIRSGRSGFTLLELIVAITVGAVVLALAGESLASALHLSEALRRNGVSWTGEANGYRWLRTAFLNYAPGPAADAGFDGKARGVAFGSRMLGADGTARACRVELAQQGHTLVADGSCGRRVLRRGVGQVAFDYLQSYGENTPWTAVFAAGTAAPLAVRIRIYPDSSAHAPADTLLFTIEPRG